MDLGFHFGFEALGALFQDPFWGFFNHFNFHTLFFNSWAIPGKINISQELLGVKKYFPGGLFGGPNWGRF